MPEGQPEGSSSKSQSERLTQETNRNRVTFLRTELQTCFTFAGMAEAEQRLGDSAHAARSLADAEKGYTTLVRFLADPKHAKHITQDEQTELTAGVERLRAQLDKLEGK